MRLRNHRSARASLMRRPKRIGDRPMVPLWIRAKGVGVMFLSLVAVLHGLFIYRLPVASDHLKN